MGGFFLDFERVSGEIATRYITHRSSSGVEASTRRRRNVNLRVSTGRATTTNTLMFRRKTCLALNVSRIR